MKNKKFLIPIIILVCAIITYIVVSCLFFAKSKPAVEKAEFPYSVTYEYNGKTTTINDIAVCEFSHSNSTDGEIERYWNSSDKNEDTSNSLRIIDTETEVLAVIVPINAAYLMGDNLADEDIDCGISPYIEYYDYTKQDDEWDPRIVPEDIDLKLVSWECAEPIQNSFSFDGIAIGGDSVAILVIISLFYLGLCVIFVRKEKDVVYTELDTAGIIINFILGFVALPFISVAAMLTDINGDGRSLDSQINYITPVILIVFLAASIVLRRKGYRKTSFFIQFAGPLVFALNFAISMAFYIFSY